VSVLALQRAAYAVEAELIGSDAIPALRETLGDLRRAPDQWIGIYAASELVAALAFLETPEVEPGLDRALVLETTATWTDAVGLYEAFGFTLTHYEDGQFGRDAYFRLDRGGGEVRELAQQRAGVAGVDDLLDR
jgi:hypothetical protein